MAQRIKKRPKVGGKRRPLKRWEKNRLRRNKAQVCKCDALPFPHRKGSTFSIGRYHTTPIYIECQRP